jgi:hypothetical protein
VCDLCRDRCCALTTQKAQATTTSVPHASRMRIRRMTDMIATPHVRQPDAVLDISTTTEGKKKKVEEIWSPLPSSKLGFNLWW